MIKDNIKNAEDYKDLPERVELGLKFLKDTDLSVMENGKYEILGSDVYAVIQDYSSKPLADGKFEAHKRYIDIQYIVKGEERIGVGDIKNFSPATDYDEERDIVFLNNNENKTELINVNENEFVIFTPKDVHMPSIEVINRNYVKKAVVKVLI